MARPADPEVSVDLHGLTPDQAERRVAQELHAARVRGLASLRVITGRGWSNPDHEPVLRRRIEAWLRSPEGRRSGAKSVRVAAKGGALDVEIR